MRFYLGTHKPYWLERTNVPLMVSHRTLAERRRLPIAGGPWVLDSGGFSELSLYGEWRTGASIYAANVTRFQREIGNLEWAAIQDWMCEPFVVARTGLSVAEHQRRTVASYVRLRTEAPGVPWLPVLQGYTPREYWECAGLYGDVGVDLWTLPLVGLGSVCRRQGSSEIADLVGAFAGSGLRLHGFGVKTKGLDRLAPHLASADSLAWSFRARRLARPLFADCQGRHINCANCLPWALSWRQSLLDGVA